MNLLKFKVDKSRQGFIKLDPRTLFLLILFSNIAIFASSSIYSEFILMASILLLCACCGILGFSLKMGVTYFIFVMLDVLISSYFGDSWMIYVAVGIRFIRKVIPAGTLGAALIQTVRVSEIMASFSKLLVPGTIIIPLTVLLRYFPSIGEDRRAIKKAMAMRGLRGGFFIHPVRTIECFYVPMMMSASRRADELSCAAITRGIENPKKRTTLAEVRFRTADYICMLCGGAVTVLCIRGGNIW